MRLLSEATFPAHLLKFSIEGFTEWKQSEKQKLNCLGVKLEESLYEFVSILFSITWK